MANASQHGVLSGVFLFQGAYFVITGLWPVLNMPSFIEATGPKQDTWLVEMVGLLATSIGVSFIVSSVRKERLPLVLAYTAAVSFLVMDLIYVMSGTISRVYLIDAAVQFIFIMFVTVFVVRKAQKAQRHG
ncbi:hypothetical protein ACFOET_15580 [Parapedobacter deserti]|uniref:DUF4345 domain-containing protein n=1 Tax=Parapedobacter deserti TaxID=1912957 RepID=A0ABV7JQ18_9SPHI